MPLRFENTEVYGFVHALKGMRNAWESWHKNDSYEGEEYIKIGDNDLQLAKKLIRGGSEHRKYLRQINVVVDITAPLYWWKEMDTYKVGTVSNSTSTMHTLTREPITEHNFAMDSVSDPATKQKIIEVCECLRKKYIDTNNKTFWKALVQILPQSWLQMRTWSANYEVVWNIYSQRKGHKLSEWSDFCGWCESLPYFKELFIRD